MSERRVGKRAEQKRRWDRENLSTCECGSAKSRNRRHCRSCDNAMRRTRADARYREIEAMWAQGLSLVAIAARLGVAKGTLSALVFRLRAEGYELPYRHRYPKRKAAA